MKKVALALMLMLLLVFTVGIISADAYPDKAGTKACTDCHNTDQRDINNTFHSLLGKGSGMGMYDKWCALPNFSLSKQGEAAWIANCTGCHIGGGCDPSKPIDCLACHENTGRGAVTAASCSIRCHNYKDKEKRGDMVDPAKDVHLGAGMTCQICHTTSKHEIGNGEIIDVTQPIAASMSKCTNCHGLTPHGVTSDAKYNDHTDKVACETCHTGLRPNTALGQKYWNKFDANGKAIETWRPAGFLPAHKWYTGVADHTTMPILGTATQKNLAGAKIYPFNEITISWFTVDGTNIEDPIITPEVKAADANGDKTTTEAEMRTYSSSKYPNATLVTEVMNYNISHNNTRTGAFKCADCHGTGGFVLNWLAMGYTSDPAAAPAGTMSVADITMAKVLTGKSYSAKATVTIKDLNGNPVAGAVVSGQWSGLTTDSDSATTDAAGKVTVSSDSIKATSGTFTFTVTGISKSGWTYDATKNVMTSNSISI